MKGSGPTGRSFDPMIASSSAQSYPLINLFPGTPIGLYDLIIHMYQATSLY